VFWFSHNNSVWINWLYFMDYPGTFDRWPDCMDRCFVIVAWKVDF